MIAQFQLNKLLITPVIAEHDIKTGRVKSEQAFEQPVVVYGEEGLDAFMQELRKIIDSQNNQESAEEG